MSIKLESVRQFLAELYDTLRCEDAEPGDIEIVVRGSGRAIGVAETALRKMITLDLLCAPVMDVLNKPNFEMTLEGVKIKIEKITRENLEFPRLKAYHEHYHRPVQFHSSQLWNLIRYARTFGTDREAYVNILREYFPTVYTAMFQQPTDQPEELEQ